MEGTHVCLWLIKIDVWQKQSQYCNYPPIKIYKLKKVSSLFLFILNYDYLKYRTFTYELL